VSPGQSSRTISTSGARRSSSRTTWGRRWAATVWYVPAAAPCRSRPRAPSAGRGSTGSSARTRAAFARLRQRQRLRHARAVHGCVPTMRSVPRLLATAGGVSGRRAAWNDLPRRGLAARPNDLDPCQAPAAFGHLFLP
jgi:hypothetical protein